MQITLSFPANSEFGSITDLKEFIEENIPLLEETLVGNLSYYSESARYETGSLTLQAIEPLSANRYSMRYRYRWILFNACLDINAEEYCEERLTFTHSGSALIFDIVDNNRPSPADEL